MEHPASGSTVGTGSFKRCRADERCGVCRLLDAQDRRERALFKTVLSRDAELIGGLQRLCALFYDAAVSS